MKYIKYFFYFIFSTLFVLTIITLTSQFFALNVDQIIAEQLHEIKPIAIKINEPQEIQPKAEPSPQKMDANLLASLAPDSMNAVQDLAGGVAFGGNGSGPGVAGGGGFGTDAGQLVSDRSKQNKPPRLVFKGELEYPTQAREKNLSGHVILKILIGTSGTVDNYEIEESSPKGVFDQAAIKSIKTWKFEPALIKGQLSAAWTTQKIKFELN